MALSFTLNSWAVTASGWGASYYAAAVRSMGMSWHNFFFASFDPTGFVSVDKPPLSLWVQVGFTKLLGYSPWVLYAPQVLSGTAAVALVMVGLRRSVGPVAALAAGAGLALTPIAVMVNRSNDTDGVMILLMTGAAVAALEAVHRGRLRWLLVAATLGGAALTAKMAAAAPVLPGLLGAYLWCAPRPWKVRAAHVAVATTLLAGVGVSWFAVVQATPVHSRPYVGSTQRNSVRELALERNGVNQVEGQGGFGGRSGRVGSGGPGFGAPGGFGPAGGGPGGPGPGGRNGVGLFGQFGLGFAGGPPGRLRLLNRVMGTQAGWLLPIAIIGGLAALYATRLRPSRRLAAIGLFGSWAVIDGYVISITKGLTHPYYLAALGPPLAALFGIGVDAWWGSWHGRRPVALLGPLALGLTGLTHWTLLRRFPWRPGLAFVSLAALFVAAVLTLALPLRRRSTRWRRAPQWVTAFSVAAVLLAPAVWLTGSIANGMNAALPYAVPFADQGGGPAEQQPGGVVPNGGFQFPNGDLAALARLLKSHRAERPRGATTDVMVPSAAAAEGLIIRFGIAAVPVGGFVGSDPIISTEQLQARVKTKAVRFFLLPTIDSAGGFAGAGFGGGGFGGGGFRGGGFGGGGPGLGPLLPGAAPTRPSGSGRGRRGGGFAGGFTTSATEFVATSCAVVDQAKWNGTTSTTMPIQTFRGGPSAAPFTLYDCA